MKAHYVDISKNLKNLKLYKAFEQK